MTRTRGLDETATLGKDDIRRATGAYLLVIQDGTTSIHPFPNPGSVTIGRAQDAEIRVDHSSVSRRHARIEIDRGRARLSDLQSHNGTRLNGVRITGEQVLATSDVISIGEISLVVYAELEPELQQVILDEAGWRRRLTEEVERALTFQRYLSVLSIAGAPAHIDELRTIDVIGRGDEGELLVLLPEADPRVARQLAMRVLDEVWPEVPGARIGIATCPVDATVPGDLVLAARAAAAAAGESGVATPVDATRRIELGDRQVLVCHPAMMRVYALLERLARAELPVLIVGETGVGKENAAYAVHHFSARRDRPFVALNCAAVPETLVESQLFGHDKGAFTGATTARPGLFETVEGGTLFLDELGELSLPVQAKLLRALETRRITRVGETKERAVEFRIVTATNRLLEREVEAKRFREDLYFRLGAARVELPPLRDRRCEIPMLFREFMATASRRGGRPDLEPAPSVLQRMLEYSWPGNVRELKHVADFLAATAEGERIELRDLPSQFAAVVPPPAVTPVPAANHDAPMRRLADELEEIERQRMTEALTRTGGVKTRAAILIGMPLRTFNMKAKLYGL